MKKEKVGILTFHSALNYGAVLQAYALKETCDELGYETHIIDYAYKGIDEAVAPVRGFLAAKNKKRGFLKLAREISSYAGDKKREREFLAFRHRYLAESVTCSSVREIEALDYDVYISGSDQIWNYRITGEKFDPVFFLNLHSPAKKVIYAASSQDTPFPLDMELKFKDILMGIDAAVGIREEKLRDYVSDLTGLEYQVVLDPTLLAGRKIIDKIPEGKGIPEYPYILLYQIDSNSDSDISVKTLERRFGCRVYTMTVPRIGSVHGRRGDAGPETFLSLLKGANFLVTNSFHGIALSLIFEKQFYVYENGGVMSRIDSLLSKFSLLDRKVKMVADIDPEDRIDFSAVTPVLKKLQEESLLFLKRGLNGEKTVRKKEKIPVKPIAMRERKKEDCCGCSACADACPVQAIRMEADQEGFLYPAIDEECCIHCGKCDKICGFHKIEQRKGPFELPHAFGVKHKDLAIRQNSRSGAAFVGFSDVVLSHIGVVYGAAMQDDFSVQHIRAENGKQRDCMKKAKYVQSSTVGIYPTVAADLKAGREVLFSGTPCQVAGLQAYLSDKKIQTDKLVCCDMVCHGVPSPEIWKQYLEYIKKQYHGEILTANFRDKDFGWDSHCESFKVRGKNKKIVTREYTDLFYEHIMFRPSCQNCQFANVNRPSDLTMGDFWDIEKQDHSDFDDNRGVSLVLVNTPRGEEIFNHAKTEFDWFETRLESCIQPTLVHPSTPSPRRSEFWRDYQKMPFDELLKKYTTPHSPVMRVKKTMKKIMYRMGIRQHP